MGLLDVVLGRRKPKRASSDRLFAIATAAVTMETQLNLYPVGSAGIVFKALETADFSETTRELEELLFKHPKVGEVAVIGVPHEKWGEEVAAFIRPAPGATIEKEELIDYMRASLAPHKTPKHWFVVDAFPLTGSGKIQKFKLREAWTKGEMAAI